jgi:hypothetical protein
MAVDATFPGRVKFVWHAIREIRNRLPDALAGEVKGSSTEYGDLTEAVSCRWKEDGLPEDGAMPIASTADPSAAGPDRHEISHDLLVAVADLVGGHIAAANRNEAKARRLFEAIAGGPVPAYVVKAWLKGGRNAHRLAHVANTPVSAADEARLLEDFELFEQALWAIASRSFQNMDDLDEILAATNR